MNNYVFWEGCKIVFKVCAIGFLTWLIKTETDTIIENQATINGNLMTIIENQKSMENNRRKEADQFRHNQVSIGKMLSEQFNYDVEIK